jgi:DNA-binding LytR/AlgR family response regulator
MTRILICDDSFEDSQSLTAIIDSFYNGNANGNTGGAVSGAKTTAYSLAKFYDPREAAAFIEDGNTVDIAILDIMMPQMDGMDLAAKMRDMGFNGYLLFLSTSNYFAEQSYSVKAFSYILKPAKKEKVFALLSGIEKTRKMNDRNGFTLSHKTKTQFVAYAEFMFAEVKNRQLFFHLIDGEVITIYGALKNYTEKLLSQSNIIRPHNSFVVNLDFVQSCENGALCMKDGTRISIPNDYKTIKEKWLERMFGGENESKER